MYIDNLISKSKKKAQKLKKSTSFILEKNRRQMDELLKDKTLEQREKISLVLSDSLQKRNRTQNALIKIFIKNEIINIDQIDLITGNLKIKQIKEEQKNPFIFKILKHYQENINRQKKLSPILKSSFSKPLVILEENLNQKQNKFLEGIKINLKEKISNTMAMFTIPKNPQKFFLEKIK